ncbi:MAG: FAD-dependent oxidoreductase [Verrucomicrobia bacterium]|nr:FAD-dependent oxidoreductase [Verrucomicrobiota bacterium]
MNISRRAAAKGFLAAFAGGAGFGHGNPVSAADLRNAPQETLKTQVCVIGGGSGGTGAALAAARAGANVILLERESILGGTGTCAWVCVWQPIMGANGIPRDLHAVMKEDPSGVSDGDYARSGMAGRVKDGKWLPKNPGIVYEPRTFDYAAREMLEATGRCQTLLATTFCRARVDGDSIKTVEAWFAGKRLLIEADVFIDCTADGDVCADAGCEFHMGEDPRPLYDESSAPEQAAMSLNALTLCYRITDTGVPQKPYLPKGVKNGSCPLGACYTKMPNGDVVVNAVGMLKGNAILCMEHSRLMREAQRRVYAHFHSIQTESAGKTQWNTWTLSGIAPRIGVRETRRILGDYVLTENDCRGGLAKQSHKDIIAIADHAIDLHGKRGQHARLDGPYGIPYRCLLPKGVRNLMIASRAASFSHIAASSCRLQRTMMTLGQAAGNAVALAIKHRTDPRRIDVAELQARLQSQGVDITEPAGKAQVKG